MTTVTTNYAAFVLTKTDAHWSSLNEDHQGIIEGNNLRADLGGRPQVLRVKMKPFNGDLFSDLNTWEFRVAQDSLPRWADLGKAEERTRRSLAQWAKRKRITGKVEELRDGDFYVGGSAQIQSVSGSAQIQSVSGSAQIQCVDESAKINSVSGSAQIYSVYGSAQIQSVSGSAQIKYVRDDAQIHDVYDSAQIQCVDESAQIESVRGSAQIKCVSGSARIQSVYGFSRIYYVFGSAQIKSVRGYVQIKSVHGFSRIKSVRGSAQIYSVSDFAKLSVAESAQVHDVFGYSHLRASGEATVTKLSRIGRPEVVIEPGSRAVLLDRRNGLRVIRAKKLRS